MTDHLSHFLNKLNNSIRVNKDTVDIRSTKLLLSVATTLHKMGFIDAPKIEDAKSNTMTVVLKRDSEGGFLYHGSRRISKLSKRIYGNKDSLRRGVNRGDSVVTTSKGVMSGTAARKENVGGEVLCEVW